MFRRIASTIIGLALAATAPAPVAKATGLAPNYNFPTASGSVLRVAEFGVSGRTALPDLVFTDGSNIQASISRYRNMVVVMNFYSTQCGSCLKDLLYLNRLQGNLKTYPIMVMVVGEDGMNAKAMKDFLARQNLGFLKPFGDPNGVSAEALGIQSLPSTIVIDKQGRLAGAVAGNVIWDSPDVQSALVKLTRE